MSLFRPEIDTMRSSRGGLRGRGQPATADGGGLDRDGADDETEGDRGGLGDRVPEVAEALDRVTAVQRGQAAQRDRADGQREEPAQDEHNARRT